MHDGTRVVRAGLLGISQGEPFLPGPTFAAPYHFSGNPSTSLMLSDAPLSAACHGCVHLCPRL